MLQFPAPSRAVRRRLTGLTEFSDDTLAAKVTAFSFSRSPSSSSLRPRGRLKSVLDHRLRWPQSHTHSRRQLLISSHFPLFFLAILFSTPSDSNQLSSSCFFSTFDDCFKFFIAKSKLYAAFSELRGCVYFLISSVHEEWFPLSPGTHIIAKI